MVKCRDLLTQENSILIILLSYTAITESYTNIALIGRVTCEKYIAYNSTYKNDPESLKFVKYFTLQENYADMENLVKQLRTSIKKVQGGGGQAAYERHVSKGKLTARQRINELLDPGSPFLELSQLAAHEMYQPDNIASAGIVCGIGKVSG